MIRTKYLGPTDTRGARIKAWSGETSVTIPYPYELSTEDAHTEAASKLADILHGFDEERIEYAVARSTQDDGYCYYRVERD
jgi:hypothetical protein